MLKWTAAVFAIAGLSHGATTPSSTQLRRTKTSPTLTPFPQGRVQLSYLDGDGSPRPPPPRPTPPCCQ